MRGTARCRGLGLALAVLALLAACAREPVETRVRFLAMGTLVEVTVFDFPDDAARAAIADVEALFRTLQDRWDPWGEGELGRLNAALGTGAPAIPGPELGELLARAAELDRRSGGLFEPAVGGLIRLWGFASEEAAPTAPPPADALAAALAAVTPLPALMQADGSLRGAPGVALDLGGFAKGEAVDLAIELLRARGVGDAIVNAGGDLRAIGRHGDRDWRIGIRAPRGEGLLASIEISGDESIFTSGDYERYFMFEGRRYHHILDPRDGQPTAGTTSVTVLGERASVADAAATALFVAGPDDWPGVAAALGVDAVMVVDAAGVVELTPAMQARVRLAGGDELETRVRPLP